MRIRKTDDRQTILALNQLIFPHSEMPDGGHHWLVKDASGEPVGFASLYPTELWDFMQEGTALYLHRYGVLPPYQGLGLGKRLLDTVLRWAKKEGFQRIVTYTWLENVASINCMISRGFRHYVPANPEWAYKGAVYLQKIIGTAVASTEPTS